MANGNGNTTGQQTGTESSLSNWAGDYVTNMMGQGQALSDMSWQPYQGPLTAGTSNLQDQAFGGIAGLSVPDEMSTASSMAEQAGGATFGTNQAEQHMNPFLDQVLQPQIREAKRQADMQRMNNASRMTKAGSYGGSRQAILEAEMDRNLQQQIGDITGQGYRDAYDQARQAWEAEQNRGLQGAQTLSGIGTALDTTKRNQLRDMLAAGEMERGIASEGIEADRAQFEEERMWPYKQVQFQQSLLDGLPLAAQNVSYQQPSTMSQFLSGSGGIMELYDMLFGGDGGSEGEEGSS